MEAKKHFFCTSQLNVCFLGSSQTIEQYIIHLMCSIAVSSFGDDSTVTNSMHNSVTCMSFIGYPFSNANAIHNLCLHDRK